MPTPLEHLQQLLPDVTFKNGASFCWSPKSRTIIFPDEALAYDDGTWALIHEAGHALLGHTQYATDFELISLEVAAWEKAKEIAKTLGVTIDANHIQDCLDTYRDWLHRRSTCPTCGSVSFQHTDSSYACHNCLAEWTVTAARFCRPYRLLKRSNKTAETKAAATATFQ